MARVPDETDRDNLLQTGCESGVECFAHSYKLQPDGKTHITGSAPTVVATAPRECVSAVREGRYDEARETMVKAFCPALDTPVLTSDLVWVPAGALQVGDRLVGADEHTVGRSAQRHLRSVEVARADVRKAQCITLWTDDGRELTVTTNHGFSVRRGANGHMYGRSRWLQARQVRVGDYLQAPLGRAWSSHRSPDLAWLGGIFDGEGNVTRRGSHIGLCFSQNPGPVLDNALRIIEANGLHAVAYKRDAARDNVVRVQMSGMDSLLRLLGTARPVRFMDPSMWEGKAIISRAYPTWTRVTEIAYDGEREVMSLEVDPHHTYLTDGVLSHNSHYAVDLCTPWHVTRELSREQHARGEKQLARLPMPSPIHPVPLADPKSLYRSCVAAAEQTHALFVVKLVAGTDLAELGPAILAHAVGFGLTVAYTIWHYIDKAA